MINTIAVANLLADILPFSTDFRSDKKNLLSGQNANRIRARILPGVGENEEYYAPDMTSWLRLQSVDMIPVDELNNIVVYTVPQLGITNRPLPGQRKAGFNLFKTIARVTAPAELNNFDRYTIEFGQRLYLSRNVFIEELARQLTFSRPHFLAKSRLILYSHIACNFAVDSDFEALRLSARRGVPTINVDWLDVDGGCDVIWNPCSSLKPVRQKLESQLNKFLDQIVEQVCASRCDLFVKGSGSFLSDSYLLYRDRYQLPKLNKICRS